LIEQITKLEEALEGKNPNEDLQSQLQIKNNELQTIQLSLTQKDEELKSLTEKKQELQNELKRIQEESKSVNLALTDLQRANSVLSLSLQTCEEKNIVLTKMQSSIPEMEEKLEKHINEKSSFIYALEKEKKSKETLEREKETIETTLETTKSENKTLREELIDIRSKKELKVDYTFVGVLIFCALISIIPLFISIKRFSEPYGSLFINSDRLTCLNNFLNLTKWFSLAYSILIIIYIMLVTILIGNPNAFAIPIILILLMLVINGACVYLSFKLPGWVNNETVKCNMDNKDNYEGYMILMLCFSVLLSLIHTSLLIHMLVRRTRANRV
jgi:hypothetical protein